MKVIKKCPLCGKDNNCKSGEETCWCFDGKVPEKLLKRIPDKDRGKACICKDCIDRFNKEETKNV